jgi:CubicO group peptidase (beta-lactamase class C family)
LFGAGALAGTPLLSPRTARAEPPVQLDALVERGLKSFEVPGLSLAVVEDGRSAVARGYGVRRLGDQAAVDASTTFPICSLTKAFTSAAMAALVADGKLGWEDKVVDRLPGFQLYDPVATREMTVRDLLSHRSGLGLGEGDLMFIPQTDFTRPELVSKLRYLKPAEEFRSGFAYDNVLYVAAGELIGAVSGKSWEAFVQERILDAVGMTDSVSSQSALKTANQASRHARIDGPVRGLGRMQALRPLKDTDLVNPAGGVNSSARDMSKWMAVQLAGGALPDGKRLWSQDSADTMWTPLAIVGATAGPVDPETDPHFVLSAPGWAVLDYRGWPVVMHAGDYPGVCTRLMLVPSRKLGLYIALNSEDEALHEAIAYSILDHYLGLPTKDYVSIAKQNDEARAARRLKRAESAKVARPTSAAAPALPFEAYAGTYRSDWYGDVIIRASGAKLMIDFTRTAAMKGPLEPWDGETFITRFPDRDTENALVAFARGADGRIETASMKRASPTADFSYDFQDLGLRRVA